MIRVDPSPILFYFYFFNRSKLVRVDPTRTQAVRVDPVQLLYLPIIIDLLTGITVKFLPALHSEEATECGRFKSKNWEDCKWTKHTRPGRIIA